MTDNYDDLLDTKQAAEILGISVGRVRQLARNGRLHGRHVGRDWVFDHDAIQQFAAAPRLKPGRPRNMRLLEKALEESDRWRNRAIGQRAVIDILIEFAPPGVRLISQAGWPVGLVIPEAPQ